MAGNAGFTTYWGEAKSTAVHLWEHLSDLNYDGKVNIDDKVFTQEASIGVNLFVQAPPNLSKPNAIRSVPILFVPPEHPECKLTITTSIFLPTGTNEYDLVSNGGDIQTLIQIFAVFADASPDFSNRLTVAQGGRSQIYVTPGVGALVSMHPKIGSVLQIGDANGIASG
eukprot:gene31266-14337_t